MTPVIWTGTGSEGLPVALAEEEAKVGSLLNVVVDLHGCAVAVEAGPDCAGESFVDPVQLIRELAQQAQVWFAEQFLDVSLVGEAQGRTQVTINTRIDLPDEGEVVFVKGGQAQQFGWNSY